MCVCTLVLVQVSAVQIPLKVNSGAGVITGCGPPCAINQIPVLCPLEEQ